MAAEVVMPKLSDTMEEGRIIRWLKKVGEPVKEGEPLLEVETDKADIEVEAFDTGILIEITADEGETVKVGEKIAVIGSEAEAKGLVRPAEEKAVAAEEKPKEEKGRVEERPEPEKEKVAAAGKPEEIEVEEELKQAPRPAEPAISIHMERREAIEKFIARRAPGKVSVSPLARELAQERGIDLSTVKGTGPDGEIVKRDIERIRAAKEKVPAIAKPEEERKINATPLAIVLAEREGVDLEEVKGTGIDRRIRESDVKAYIALRCEQRGEEYRELSLMRKTIARRMTESKKTIPHFYLTMAVHMDAAIGLRKKLNEGKKDEEKISVNDIVVKAAALALEEIPEVNSTFVDDKIRVNKKINVGVATATPDGLVVPVIFDANKKSAAEIAVEAKDKAERARKRKLKPDEYSNATFTVSNLGMFGIEHFAAIIDPGQSAILAVGALQKEPIVVDGKVEVAQMMRVTLSCDHRVVDGYTGTQYLVKLKSILEQPEKVIS